MPSIGQTWVLAYIGAVVEMGVLSHTLKRLLMESMHVVRVQTKIEPEVVLVRVVRGSAQWKCSNMIEKIECLFDNAHIIWDV
jgi:hypothetical protein